MAEHLDVLPANVTPGGFTDAAAHRQPMSPIYNQYSRLAADPEHDPARIGLRSCVLHQKDNSVVPEDLLMQAIRLKGGNVQQGLMVAWDLLREGWQDADARNFIGVSRKLVDITGEHGTFDGNHPKKYDISDPLNPNKDTKWKMISGDKYSSWYHIVGTMLQSFSAASNGQPASKLGGGFRIWLEEHVLPLVMGQQFNDPFKRRKYDHEGSRAGAEIFQLLSKHPTADSIPVPAKGYLYVDPDKLAGREKIDRPRERPADAGPTLVERITGWEALRNNPTAANYETLLDAFRRENGDAARYAIVSILAQWPSENALERLTNILLSHPVEKMRESVLAALVGRSDDKLEPIIERALRDPSPRVRSIAVLMLEDRMGRPETVGRLRAALTESSPLVQNSAAVVIQAHPDAVPADLRDAGLKFYAAAKVGAPGTTRKSAKLAKFLSSCRLLFSILKESRKDNF
jgi:hypothetical protein